MRGLIVSIAACAAFEAMAAFDLSGEWKVSGDGFSGAARLPGTLAEAGFGEKQNYATWYAVSNKMERYALRLSHRYLGKAVWTRKVTIPKELAAKPLEFFFERVMWVSTLRVDGKTIGTRDSLGTPHVYGFKPGELAAGEHAIELEIDNSRHYDFSGWAHSWGPTTQTRWNGVIGKAEIREANPLSKARVFAKWPANGAFEIDVPEEAAIEKVEVGGLEVKEWKREGNRVRVAFEGEPVYWSEAHPRRYALTLKAPGGYTRRMKFAFRTFERRGQRLYLNGVPLWIRGDVDNCQFPLTGYPAMTPAEWRRQIRIQQLNGCNAMRAHTWTPPEAAYEAADELGFIWMVECGFWTDGWMKASPVGARKDLDEYLHGEIMRVCDTYGDHPSIMSISVGNELGSSDFGILNDWMAEAKKRDGRFLTTATSARKICPTDDYSTTHNYPDIGSVRCWRHPHTDWDYEKAYAKAPIPVIAHEIGQWPVYPYWDDMSHFTGLLKPFDWMWLRSLAVTNDTIRFTRRWHTASMKSNRLMYKDEVESFMRTPTCAGLQLLDVRDYTGQGEALIGWLDADFAAKPGVSEVGAFSSVFRPVPFLARFKKYTWNAGETFAAKLQVRNLTEEPLPAGLRWPWSFGGKTGYVALDRELAPCEIATVATVRVKLEDWMCETKQTLRFGENSWDIWVFPDEEKVDIPRNVVVTPSRELALASLAKGRRVLYTGTTRTTGRGKFEPVYWSSIHFPSKDPSVAIGTWYDEDHPAFDGFPTEDWMDWQWRSLADHSTVHVLRDMPKGFEPIAMPVSDLHFSEMLATMFELNVGKGRLFVCGYNLDAETPEAIALRRSLFEYLKGDRFAPRWGISAAAAKRLLTPDPRAVQELHDFDVEKTETTMKITVKNAQPVQGHFAVKFDDTGDVEGTFEGKPCRIRLEVDGEMRLMAQMNREDALDGKFEFKCRATKGHLPRFVGVEVIPE